MPTRIQRKRTKGWRMPQGAVYVGRPTKWGNPFAVDSDWMLWTGVALGFTGDRAGRHAAAVALYRLWLTGKLPRLPKPKPGGDIEFDSGRRVSAHEHVMGFGAAVASLCEMPTIPDERPDLQTLRGKNLACFCKPDEPCHADVLLELANAPTTGRPD